MLPRLTATAVSAVFLVLASGPLFAGDWPQWRGPTLDGRSPEEGLPVRWGPEENLAWKLPMPARSGATPIVWGDRIFLNVSYDPRESNALELWCVDAGSGRVLWKRSLGGGNELRYKQHMSSPSPATDGEAVFVMTGTGTLKAFSFAGEELWSRDLQQDYGAFGHNWGYAASPLLFEGSLYVPVLHGFRTDEPSYLLRIDTATGETVWRTERPTEAVYESPDAYTTPALLGRGGEARIVLSGGDVVTAHDPGTGRELWRAGGLNPDGDRTNRLVASPVTAGDLVFAFGKRGPVLALAAGGQRGGGEPRLAWSMTKGTDVPTPATDGRYLYMVNDQGLLWCLDARTGELHYGPERLATGTYSASPLLADGKLYAVSEEGVTTVVAAGPAFQVLAENRLEGYTLSSPAAAQGRLFIRTAEYLYAIGNPEG